MTATILKIGRLLDGHGGPAIEHGYLQIEDGKITRAGAWNAVEHQDPAATVIEAPDCTALPGLINAHSHYASQRLEVPSHQVWQWPETLQILRAASKGKEELERGVTSTRDLGAKGTLNIVLKRAIQMGITVGPRMVVCGQLICTTGGHGYYMGREVDGPDAMRVAVREMLKLGADFIKVVASGGMNLAGPHPIFPWESHVTADPVQQELTEEELSVAAEEAHKVGRRLAAHAYGIPAISASLRAGADTLEHGIWLDDEWADYMAEHDQTLVPTVSGLQQYVDFGPKRGTAPFVIERAKRAHQAHKETIALAHAHGVRIATGTDNSGDMWREMELFVESGMSRSAAIVAATKHAAEALDIAKEVGTLENGKYADVLVVRGNPLDRISDIRNVQMVLQAGKVVFRATETQSA